MQWGAGGAGPQPEAAAAKCTVSRGPRAHSRTATISGFMSTLPPHTRALFVSCCRLVGYAIAFGEDGNAFVGAGDWALVGSKPHSWAVWVFQFSFACTASTIVSGAVCGRMKFKVSSAIWPKRARDCRDLLYRYQLPPAASPTSGIACSVWSSQASSIQVSTSSTGCTQLLCSPVHLPLTP